MTLLFRCLQAPGTHGTQITHKNKTPTYVRLRIDIKTSQHTLLLGRGDRPVHAEDWPQAATAGYQWEGTTSEKAPEPKTCQGLRQSQRGDSLVHRHTPVHEHRDSWELRMGQNTRKGQLAPQPTSAKAVPP